MATDNAMTCCQTNPGQRTIDVPGAHEAKNPLTYRAAVDVLETGDEYIVHADMPGASADAIDIRVEDGSLHITGEVRQRYPAGARVFLNEYGVGDFDRSFRLAEDVDADRITADYESGVLTVRLPKREQARAKKIAVRSATN